MGLANKKLIAFCVVFAVLVGWCGGVFGWSLFRPGSDAVRLQDVRVLTFSHAQQTTARRMNAIPQLQCVGGAAQGGALPMTVVCHNAGTNGGRGLIDWECVGDLPAHFTFGRTEVNCEGFRYPEDEWVLDGSCGLRYTLEYTSGRSDEALRHSRDQWARYEEAQQQQYQARPHSPYAFTNMNGVNTRPSSSWMNSVVVVFGLFFVAVALFGFASIRPARHLPEWATQFGPGVSPIGGYHDAFPTSPLFLNDSGPWGLLGSGALGYFLGWKKNQQRRRPGEEWVPEALRNRRVPNLDRPVPARAGTSRR